MSWTRTAIALIGFGFTIVQIFDRMQQAPGLAPARFPEAPRFFGLALILCGVAALCIAVWQYHWSLRYLWGENFAVIAGATKEGLQTPLYAVAIALIVVGAIAFLTVLVRLI
jgi:putative membrane protein